MKKVNSFFALLILLLIPNSVRAAAISYQALSGAKNVNVGEEVEVVFELKLDGIKNTTDATEGIWQVGFSVEFDETVFTLENVKSDSFETSYIKTNGIHIISAEVLEGSANTCVHGGLLYCGTYRATMKFFVKDTKASQSTIKVGAIAVGVLNMNDPEKEEYLESDMEPPVTTTSYASHTIKINQKEEIPKVNNSSVNNTPTIKSSNALLKSLTVENYDIKFDTYLLEYTLEVEENINSLSIKAETEDGKASYKVVGAEDLKANGNKFTVEVTAENGSQKTYIINTKMKEKKSEKEKSVAQVEEPKKEEAKVNKKFLLYLGILFGGIILIVIIGFIISKIKNRKLNKMLDQL